MFEWQLPIIHWLQSLSPGLDMPMRIITAMGDFEFYMLIIPMLYWCVDPRLGLWSMMAAGLSHLTTTYFKQATHFPRPYWAYDSVKLLLPGGAGDFSTPSGHASGTLAFWGAIALHYQKRWIWTAVIIFCALVGISRVYLGVHFPSDILLGWGLAIVLLLLLFVGRRMLPATLGLHKTGRAIFYAFMLFTALIAIGVVIVLVNQVPIWVEEAPDAFSMGVYFRDGGIMFGALVGYILLSRDLRYSAEGSVIQKIARYVFGCIVLVGIWIGLDILFEPLAPEASPLGLGLRFVRYMAMGLWVGYIAPLIFVWTGLAGRQKRRKSAA